ncbi:MAG: prolyl oligopeptidase family serine peptidase [Planctomycetaceae bacterium]
MGRSLPNIDPNRLAVMGGSAGGYLTLMTGFVHPRPKVLAAFWGYGDLLGDWYTKPSPHPRHNNRKISKAEADAQAGGPVISDARQRSGRWGHLLQLLSSAGSVAVSRVGLGP